MGLAGGRAKGAAADMPAGRPATLFRLGSHRPVSGKRRALPDRPLGAFPAWGGRWALGQTGPGLGLAICQVVRWGAGFGKAGPSGDNRGLGHGWISFPKEADQSAQVIFSIGGKAGEHAKQSLTKMERRKAMPTWTLTGIVLRYANYRDSDRILTILTRERGKLSAAARGCRKPNSRLFGCSELFTYGEYVLFEGKGKMTVDNCDVRERFYPLREDVGRFAAGAYMLSVTEAIAAPGQPNEGLFALLYYALSYAAYKEQNPTDLAICFLARCLALQGYAPRLTHCARCGQDLRHLNQLSFSPRAGGAVCMDCRDGDSLEISPLALEAVRRMLLLSNQDMDRVALPDLVRNQLKAALHAYGEYVLERPFRAMEQL